jgi:phosphatidate cytidylyltransferase
MFKQRVLTGIVGGAVFLGAVWYGGLPFSFIIALLAVVGYSELVRMKGLGRFSTPALLGYLVTLLYVFPEGLERIGLNGTAGDSVSVFWLVIVLFLFLSISVATKNRYAFPDMTYLFAGTLYLGLPFGSAMLLRDHPEHGLAYFLFVLILMWTTDTFAYLIGRALKGPKIWPAISPNKTVSGSVGGVLGAVLAGVIFANVVDQAVTPWVLLAALLSVLGQLGDFVESGLKRALGVKDSGAILPGHGGVLDRFDSFLFAAPIAYYVIMNVLA